MKTQLCYDNVQQIANDFNAVLTLPSLTNQQRFQIDDAWLTAFKSKAHIPNIEAYEGNRRLGFYYQWLWLQLINSHPDYALVAEEVQLNWQNQTLGAIDFLVKNLRTNEVEHWEVAIKFYLAYQGQWLGPNASDNLDKKTARMVDHQLRLTEHPAYQTVLQSQYGLIRHKRLIMQGRLFDCIDDKQQGSNIAINPATVNGKWCFKHQAIALTKQHYQFFTLSKPQWICPPRPSTSTQKKSPYLELDQLTTPTQAIDQNDQVWFIVPDHWPLHNNDLIAK